MISTQKELCPDGAGQKRAADTAGLTEGSPYLGTAHEAFGSEDPGSERLLQPTQGVLVLLRGSRAAVQQDVPDSQIGPNYPKHTQQGQTVAWRGLRELNPGSNTPEFLVVRGCGPRTHPGRRC